MKRLYLFRHGETNANRAGILQGHLDTKLSRLGEIQAAQLGHYSRQLTLDAIHSSDLARAIATTKQLAQHHHCPVIFSDQLREVSYGPLEGKMIQQLSKLERSQLQQFYQDKKPLPYVEAESMMQLESRLLGYIDIIQNSSQQNHAIVSHGQALNCLLHSLLGWPKHSMYMLELTNCSVTELKFNQLGWQLIRLNQDVTTILKEKDHH